MVELGVGKNMVRAIRYWGLVCGIWSMEARKLQNTPLGEKLLSDNGWDPCLDETGTLWLLHWELAHRQTNTSWWYLFARPSQTSSFTKEDLIRDLSDLAFKAEGQRPSQATLIRDVEALLHTYIRPRHTELSEENLGCPLAVLELIQGSGKKGNESYRLLQGRQPSLPIGIFTAALMTFLREQSKGDIAVSFSDLLYMAGSPGRVFCLSENALMDRLAQAAQWIPELIFDETAGIRQILLRANAPSSLDILNQHYRGKA